MRAALRVLIIAVLVAVAPAPLSAQSSSDFFNSDAVQRVELWVNEDDWEKLKVNFQENDYYPANVIWNGMTVRNVAIRSRGLGSRSGTKPGLRVDIDRYTDSQTFLGLKSFILDNLTQDPSAIHETVAMKFFARMGLPAPREAHTRLYVNGEYAGLYALVESIDKTFLARVFGEINGDTQNDGFLYEYKFTSPWRFSNLGDDLAPYMTRFEPKTHEDAPDEKKWRPIEEIVRLANELPADRLLEELDPKLDLRSVTRYVAIQNFLGENDGFVGYDGMNNFYFYRKENSDQHVFIAWDEDNAFWGPTFELTTRHDENELFRKMMQVSELRDLYYATLLEAARSAQEPAEGTDQPWLDYEIRRQLDLIAGPINEDTKKPYSNDDHSFHRTLMLIFAAERGRYVESNVPR